ncbi:hypothetical protein FHX37_0476 [Haloactinospora alba]|uniref:Uncharacterized protein n=1 Tax=Haloactinospora alba TaxID=405555 RepID=A0A543NFH8_9ACTN|nr:hypothetical protein [Haloactinospora alba]TQN30594.1 hypothetical protein FHX37_0476 [Haloactinospora alba]
MSEDRGLAAWNDDELHGLHIQRVDAQRAAAIERDAIRHLCLTMPTGGAR